MLIRNEKKAQKVRFSTGTQKTRLLTEYKAVTAFNLPELIPLPDSEQDYYCITLAELPFLTSSSQNSHYSPES